jgi:transposase, IS5 family
MRTKFEIQYSIGQKRIEDTEINIKCRAAFPKIIFALKELFINTEYRDKLFKILSNKITKDKKQTGRTGMDLWKIFVLAHTRLCLNITYDTLLDLANNHFSFRQILGVEMAQDFKRVVFEYQNIVDNVDLLNEDTLLNINDLIVEMGHKIYKKKEEEKLQLKTDSFVVKSNVHYPTDYNLLWDSARKCIDFIEKLIKKYPQTTGWRNLSYWYKTLKNKLREITLSGKKNEENKKKLVEEYIEKARLFAQKIDTQKKDLPLKDEKDLFFQIELDYYQQMLSKHIGLMERRLIKGETIPHDEKIFSIFESYTEWINKGKQNPNFELGKNVQVTSDQYHLIIDYKIMENEVDKSTVIPLADRILSKYKVNNWSFDKGFHTKLNKELLSLFINDLIMPKKGKLNKAEKEEEHTKTFKKLRNKHSAIESNINELEHRGLDRCPDKGYEHFKRYIALGICAYNLHKIGNELLKQEKQKVFKSVA